MIQTNTLDYDLFKELSKFYPFDSYLDSEMSEVTQFFRLLRNTEIRIECNRL